MDLSKSSSASQKWDAGMALQEDDGVHTASYIPTPVLLKYIFYIGGSSCKRTPLHLSKAYWSRRPATHHSALSAELTTTEPVTASTLGMVPTFVWNAPKAFMIFLSRFMHVRRILCCRQAWAPLARKSVMRRFPNERKIPS